MKEEEWKNDKNDKNKVQNRRKFKIIFCDIGINQF